MWYKLSDLFDLQMGKTPSRNNPNYWNSKDYLWVSISDMSGYDKYVSSTKEYISERAVKESGIKIIPANTVIMSFKLSIGKTAITTESIFSNEAIMAFIDKKTTAIDPEYIFYLFSGKDWDEGSNKAVMGKTLNKATLSNTEVDIPSLDIQKERVDKLNKISTLIADKKQQLNQLDELVKARFVEMFGDVYKTSKYPKQKWNNIVTIKNGKDYKKVAVNKGGYPVYGTGGEIARTSEFLCPENTIIVGRKGTINNPLLVREKFWNVDTAFGVIPSDKLHYLYFFWFCKMFDFSRLNKQAVLPSTTKADLLNIEMQVPPIEIQNKFAAFVAQVDKSKFALSNELAMGNFYIRLIYDCIMHSCIDL